MIEVLKIIAALWSAITIHEMGHVAAVKGIGGEVTSIQLYPNKGNLASVSWEVPAEKENQLWIADLGGVAASMASAPILSALSERYPEQTFFNYWEFFATMDLPYQSVSSFWRKENDISRFCDRKGISKMIPLIASGVWLYSRRNSTQKNFDLIFQNGILFFKCEF